MGVVGMGCGRRWGGGVCCLLEVSEGCSCQVNVLQCTLEGVEIWVPHQAAVLEVWADQTPIGISLDGLGDRF